MRARTHTHTYTQTTRTHTHTSQAVTPQFVSELLAWQKSEKKLHRKYALQILYKVRDVLRSEVLVFS